MTTMALPVIAQQRSNRGVTPLVLAYVFLLVSRLIEFMAILGLGAFPLLMIASIIGVVVVVLTGGVLPAFASSTAKFVLALTVWILMATATSTWHSGSLTMLQEQWGRTLLVFLIVAGAVTTFGQFRLVALTVGWGTAFAGVMSLLLGSSIQGRLGLSTGMLGNPNLLAFHLLFGLPFCFYVIQESGKVKKVVMYGAIAIMAKVILGTGSRGGFIIAAVLIVMIFFHVSVANRMKLIVASPVVVSVVLALTPTTTMERYRTMFSDDETGQGETLAYQSAVSSKDARMTHLLESLTLTLQNPLFGVGPGVFAAASAEYEKKAGLPQSWRETHNAYTQVSSECGIPGLILFLCVLGSAWRTAFRVGRMAKARGNLKIGNLAFYLKLSLMAFAVGAFLASNAYQYYVLLLAAMAIVMDTTAGIESTARIERNPIRVAAPASVGPAWGQQSEAAGPRIRFGGYHPRSSQGPPAGTK